MNFVFLDAWHRYLPREGGHLVTVRGGGGRSHLVRVVARRLAADGVPVAVAAAGNVTEAGFVACPFFELVAGGGARPERIRVVSDGDPAGQSAEGMDRLGAALTDHVLIHEAVGATAADLPRHVSLAITVTGLSDVGRAPTEAATGAEPPPKAWLTAGDPAPVWSWDGVVAFLAAAAPGGRRPVPHVAALMEVEACADGIGLFACVERIMTDLAIPLVTLGSASDEGMHLRTACAQPDEEAS